MPEADRYDLLLAFVTDHPAFVDGFQLGVVWAGTGAGEREFTVHSTGAEMLLRIGEARGLHVRAAPIDDRWLQVTFGDDPA